VSRLCRLLVFATLCEIYSLTHVLVLLLNTLKSSLTVKCVFVSKIWSLNVFDAAPIDLVHIPHLIIELYVAIPFYTSYFPSDGINGTRSSKGNGKDNEFEYDFLVICRYFTL